MAVQRWTDEMLDALSSDVAAIQLTLAQVADLQVDLARAMGRVAESQSRSESELSEARSQIRGLALGQSRLQESMAELQAEVRALTAGQARMQEAITESQAMIRTLAAGQEQQQRILEQFMRYNSDSP